MLLAPALTALGVGAEVAGPLSSILFTGLSIALSIIFAPKVPKPEDGKIPFQQSVPPRIRIIGQRRTAGAFMLYHADGAGTFFGISAFCEGPANRASPDQDFVRYYLHDDVIELQADGVTVGSLGEGRYGQDKVKIYTRVGASPAMPYGIAVSALTPLWTNDHRGDGICSGLLWCADAGANDQSLRFPLGLPVLSVVVDATQVHDPREDDLQDWSDPSTWGDYNAAENPNTNPILQAMWFLTASIEKGGIGLDMAEAFVPVFGDIKAQADVCDEQIPNKEGGTLPRYRSGALYHFSDAPGDVLAAILGTCDGFCAENGDGTFTLKAGKWDDDDFSVVILDRHIISLNVKRFKPDEDEVTGVIVKYTSRDHEYVTIDAPVWPRDAYQGGEDHRVRPIEVTYCTAGRQAQRIAKRVAVYEMAPVSGTAVLKMWGVQLLNKRGATIQCTDDPALADCKVRLTRVEPNLVEGTVTIDFTVFDPLVCDAWDASTEEGPLQPPVSVPFHGAFSTPSNLLAVASQVGSVIGVDIEFDPGVMAGDNTEYYYRYRIADLGGGTPGAWITGNIGAGAVDRQSPSNWIVTIGTVPAEYLEFQLQAHQHDFSSWSVSVFVHAENPSPGHPYNFTATLSGADVVLNWTAPNSANMDHAVVFRQSPTGGSVSTADDISGDISGAAKAAMTFTDTAPASATYDYWIIAYDVADVSSLARGPETVTVP